MYCVGDPPIESASVQGSALDERQLFDEDSHEFFRVAEVRDVGKSRLTFRTGKPFLHSLHAVEVKFAELIVRRLVSFEVLQGMILNVTSEPRYLLQDRCVCTSSSF